jgi:hypothetical protein
LRRYEDYALQSQALEHYVGCCGRDAATLRFPEVEFINKVVRVITPSSFTTRPYGGGRAVRLQVPLILAWALTVHKCQGSSLDFVDVDCDDFFAEGQVYVALSRARSKAGMRVRNFDVQNSRSLCVKNRDALAFYDAMSREAGAPGSVAAALDGMQPWWTAAFGPDVKQVWRDAFSSNGVFQWWCRCATWGRSQLQMFAVLQQLDSARAFLRLLNTRGVAPAPLHNQTSASANRRKFRADVAVYSVVTAHPQRLRALGGAVGTAKLAQRISRVWEVAAATERHRLVDGIVRRVAAGRSSKTAEGLYYRGQCMYASGQYVEAAAAYTQCIAQGYLPPRADLAHMLIDGRHGVGERSSFVAGGVERDAAAAFQLVGEGARAECPHSQGVLARCYFSGISCARNAARSLQLARASASQGCRHGQYVTLFPAVFL